MVRLTPATLAAAVLLLAAGSGVAATTWPPASTPPRIHATAESGREWRPSAEQMADVRRLTDLYYAAKDKGLVESAYAMMAESAKTTLPIASYSDGVRIFNRKSGALKERRVIGVTWSKDPAKAPAPGVYAAVDMVSRFANIDRHCGFLVLYQPPSGGSFRVVREEANFIDNDAARSIERQHSRAELEAGWARLSANCPGTAGVAAPAPLREPSHDTTGYPSVAAAFDALHAQGGVTFSNKDGWVIAVDLAASTVWSFAPPEDPAYPAVVKRLVVPHGAGSEIRMDIQCEAAKPACDDLARRFKQLNAEVGAAPPAS